MKKTNKGVKAHEANTPKLTNDKVDSKIQKYTGEMTLFYRFLSDKVTSCTDAASVLNIPQKNLTRYKRKFEKLVRLQIVKIHRCPHTGRWVQYLTTDRNQFLKPVQLEIPFSQP